MSSRPSSHSSSSSSSSNSGYAEEVGSFSTPPKELQEEAGPSCAPGPAGEDCDLSSSSSSDTGDNPTESSASVDGKQPASISLRIASYNVFLRPPGIVDGGSFLKPSSFGKEKKDARVSHIVNAISKFDIVGLQEAFDAYTDRQEKIINGAKKKGFKFHHRSSPAPKIHENFTKILGGLVGGQKGIKKKGDILPLVDGGLVLLSKYPISKKMEKIFKEGAGTDRFATKGVLYALVHHPITPIHVFLTHLQAGFKRSGDVPHDQLDVISALVRENTINDDYPLIVMGDFNIDYRVPEFRPTVDAFRDKHHLRDPMPLDESNLRIPTSLNKSKSSIDYILHREHRAMRHMATYTEELEKKGNAQVHGHLSDHVIIISEFAM